MFQFGAFVEIILLKSLLLIIRTHQLVFMKKYGGLDGPQILTVPQALMAQGRNFSIADFVNSLN